MGYALEAFMDHLMQEEYTENTLSKYRRDLGRFLEYQGDQPMTKELVIRYKKPVASLQGCFCQFYAGSGESLSGVCRIQRMQGAYGQDPEEDLYGR